MKLIGDDMPVGEAEAHAPACGGDGELDGAGASGGGERVGQLHLGDRPNSRPGRDPWGTYSNWATRSGTRLTKSESIPRGEPSRVERRMRGRRGDALARVLRER